jgi:hypothetical protein
MLKAEHRKAISSQRARSIIQQRPSAKEGTMTSTNRQDENSILLTVFLKHDQSMTVSEIGEILDQSGFYQKFPPEGTHVVSWYVMMGIGQVVTLEVPASLLRSVNLAVEQAGWKAYRTEFYATYNLYPHLRGKLKNKSVKSLNAGDD